MLPIPLAECHSGDKCLVINLCHLSRQRPKIELCFIELRWSLAQLQQLSILIDQSISRTIRGIRALCKDPVPLGPVLTGV